MHREPTIERISVGGLHVHTDIGLRARHGITVAFTERGGGVSEGRYSSLNLAPHVGDDPRRVDENRARTMDALGLGALRERLITAEQVHGDTVRHVGRSEAGLGAFAGSGAPPIPACDALVTTQADIPLMMMYADCVPVVLVVLEPQPAIAVAHAGWRGALSGIVSKAVRALAEETLARPRDIVAYVGPHIGPCCYRVDEDRVSQFRSTFVTITAVGDGLDLGAVVRQQLEDAGVPADAVAQVGACTSDNSDRFFSYRASGVTGRHAALGAIAKGD